MAAKKSQIELERTAKVYQVEALESRVHELKDLVHSQFGSVNTRLDTLIAQSENQVSTKAFEDRLTALAAASEERLKNAIDLVHTEYSPMKSKVTRLDNMLGGAIIIQVIWILFNIFGSK